MLIVFQIPFADLRIFHPDLDNRLAVPTWPKPQFNEFIRAIGGISRRKKGGLDDLGEAHYCSAARLVKIDSHYLSDHKLHIAFRRLFFDGTASGKVEIGFVTHQQRIDIPTLIKIIAQCPCRITFSKLNQIESLLLEAGSKIARSYLINSSATGSLDGNSKTSHHVKAGTPAIYIESDAKYTELVGELRLKSVDMLVSECNIFLGTCWEKYGNINFRILLCERLPDGKRKLIRHLRLWLLRLHAQRQALAAVLKQLATGKIKDSNDQRSDLLQRYLKDAIRQTRKSFRRLQKIKPNGEMRGDCSHIGDLYDKFLNIENQTNWDEKLNAISPLSLPEADSPESDNPYRDVIDRLNREIPGIFDHEIGDLSKIAVDTDIFLSGEDLSGITAALDSLNFRKNIGDTVKSYLDEWKEQPIITPNISLFHQENIMEKNTFSGQTIYMKDNAKADNITLNQGETKELTSQEKEQLINQLSAIIKEMQQSASTPDEKIALANVEAAKDAAEEGNKSKLAGYLKAGGEFALSIAERISAGVATALIKQAQGM